MQDKPIVNAAKLIVAAAIVILLLGAIGCGSSGKTTTVLVTTTTSQPNPYTSYAEAACVAQDARESPECLREREAQCSYAHPPSRAWRRLRCIEAREPDESPPEALREIKRGEKESLAEEESKLRGKERELHKAEEDETLAKEESKAP